MREQNRARRWANALSTLRQNSKLTNRQAEFEDAKIAVAERNEVSVANCHSLSVTVLHVCYLFEKRNGPLGRKQRAMLIPARLLAWLSLSIVRVFVIEQRPAVLRLSLCLTCRLLFCAASSLILLGLKPKHFDI
jgi:hypothetical protein